MKYVILFFLFFIFFTATAKQIEVCKTCTIKTIKDAIKIAENGDEILIKKGLYKENNIAINKSISLIGKEGVIIDAEGSLGIVVFKVDNFTIKGLKIINIESSYTKEFAAIKVIRSSNFIIEDCILENIFFGIIIEKSKDGIIRNNTVSSNRENEANSGNGIHVWDGNRMEVYNNELFGMRDGIYFEFVKNSKAYKNCRKWR